MEPAKKVVDIYLRITHNIYWERKDILLKLKSHIVCILALIDNQRVSVPLNINRFRYWIVYLGKYSINADRSTPFRRRISLQDSEPLRGRVLRQIPAI